MIFLLNSTLCKLLSFLMRCFSFMLLFLRCLFICFYVASSMLYVHLFLCCFFYVVCSSVSMLLLLCCLFICLYVASSMLYVHLSLCCMFICLYVASSMLY